MSTNREALGRWILRETLRTSIAVGVAALVGYLTYVALLTLLEHA